MQQVLPVPLMGREALISTMAIDPNHDMLLFNRLVILPSVTTSAEPASDDLRSRHPYLSLDPNTL